MINNTQAKIYAQLQHKHCTSGWTVASRPPQHLTVNRRSTWNHIKQELSGQVHRRWRSAGSWRHQTLLVREHESTGCECCCCSRWQAHAGNGNRRTWGWTKVRCWRIGRYALVMPWTFGAGFQTGTAGWRSAGWGQVRRSNEWLYRWRCATATSNTCQ